MKKVAPNHPVYMAWASMKRRCNNPNSNGYEYYGGRGIGYCPSWEDFDNFYADMFPAWKEGLSLDRERSEEDYSPQNCRWVTPILQRQNRRNCMEVETVHAVRRLREEGLTQGAIAQKVGATRSAVSDILNGRSWCSI